MIPRHPVLPLQLPQNVMSPLLCGSSADDVGIGTNWWTWWALVWELWERLQEAPLKTIPGTGKYGGLIRKWQAGRLL